MPVSSFSLSLSFFIFVCRSLFFFRVFKFQFQNPLLLFCENSRVSFTFTTLILTQEPKMSVRKGSKVWAEDRDLAWVPAEVLGSVGKQVQVVTSSGKKVKNEKQILSFFSVCKFWLFLVLVCLGIGFAGEIISERCGWGRSCWSGRYDQVDVFEWAWCALQSSEEICSQWYICESKSHFFKILWCVIMEDWLV